jgi:hypothetical protein
VSAVRVVVVCESYSGCTAALARAVADELAGSPHAPQVELHQLATAPTDLRGVDLLVVGVPTHLCGLPSAASRWLQAQWWGDPQGPARPRRPHGRPRPRRGAREWSRLVRLSPGTPAAVFDTRSVLRAPGTAAAGLARRLLHRGARLVLPPEGFVVHGVRGPLVDGEVQRAHRWARAAAEATEAAAAR